MLWAIFLLNFVFQSKHVFLRGPADGLWDRQQQQPGRGPADHLAGGIPAGRLPERAGGLRDLRQPNDVCGNCSSCDGKNLPLLLFAKCFRRFSLVFKGMWAVLLDGTSYAPAASDWNAKMHFNNILFTWYAQMAPWKPFESFVKILSRLWIIGLVHGNSSFGAIVFWCINATAMHVL